MSVRLYGKESWRASPPNVCYQFDPTTLGLIMGGSAGLSALGSVASGLIGSSSAANAEQAAMTGEAAATQAAYGGAQSATATMSPYTQGGLTNYNYLNYLLTGQGGASSSGYSSPAMSSGNNAGQPYYWSVPAGASADQIQSAINTVQSYLGSFHGDLATTYAGAYSQAEQQLSQLQSALQQTNASQQSKSAVSSGGLPANYLTTPFNLNTAMTSGNGNQMLNLAMQQIAAQHSATGNVNSGNQSTDIANYIGGTFEPTLYNQYTGNQNQVYNYLTGNVGGSGQSANTTVAGYQNGAGNAAAGYAAQGGQTAASGTAAQGTAWNNALTGVSNAATTAGGQYMNYMNTQNIANALKNNGDWQQLSTLYPPGAY